jgi:hypothetical protein
MDPAGVDSAVIVCVDVVAADVDGGCAVRARAAVRPSSRAMTAGVVSASVAA